MDDLLADQLKQFGLTEKEIETYLVLLENGETIVSTISEQAGVSKRHVYNTASRLEERNLVEINDFVTPARLRPIPPDQVKQRFSHDVNQLHKSLEERFSPSELNLRRIEVLKSRSTLLKWIRQILTAATSRIAIALPSSLLQELRTELVDAVDRGVLVLVLLTNETEETVSDRTNALEGVAHAVRISRREMAIQLAVDHSYGLLAPLGILSNNSDNRSKAIALGDHQLEPVILSAFNGNEWPFSNEIYVREPDDLPKSYTTHRLAVLQAALYDQDDVDLFAKVKAYDMTGTEDYNQTFDFEGEVINVVQRIVEPTVNLPLATLELDTGDDIVSIGGPRCTYEDYEAIRTRLEVV